MGKFSKLGIRECVMVMKSDVLKLGVQKRAVNSNLKQWPLIHCCVRWWTQLRVSPQLRDFLCLVQCSNEEKKRGGGYQTKLQNKKIRIGAWSSNTKLECMFDPTSVKTNNSTSVIWTRRSEMRSKRVWTKPVERRVGCMGVAQWGGDDEDLQIFENGSGLGG